MNNVEVYNALGTLDSFEPALPGSIPVTAAALLGTVFSFQFRSTPGVTSWKVLGTGDHSLGFPNDLTSLPTTSIIESTLSPGTYDVMIDVADHLSGYFVKVVK